ncbi:MAG: glycosyltransferase family 4 protein [Polynucleobacter sp.]|nr:glycosyltransferase family 4 protein [Polynucleobacter sp.]
MIFFVGPLPPPVHGFSAVNAKIADLLKIDQCAIFDLSPRTGVSSVARRFLLSISDYFSFANRLIFRRPSLVYFGLSGGSRQWIDALYVWLCTVVGVRSIIHHHSFAYLNTPSIRSRLLFSTFTLSTHVVLCDCMKAKLISLYGIESARIIPVSNAAFVDLPSISASSIYSQHGRFSLGFLSNISLAKGIKEVFEIFDTALSKSDLVELVIAGPIDHSIKEWFEDQILLRSNVRYLGPVYGAEKSDFFQSIDLFLFPTSYVNEAEPMVILEALSYGISVAANDRGCIASLLDDSIGGMVNTSTTSTGDWIAEAIADPVCHEQRSFASRRKFEQLKFDAERRLSSLINSFPRNEV